MEAPAVVNSPAPSIADAGIEAPSAEAVVGPSETEDGGDEVAVARRKAREILFAEGEPEPEAPKEAPKPAEKPKDESDLSRGFAKLHDQEKRLKEKQRLHLEEAQAFKAEREQHAARAKDLEIAYTDPVAFLSKAGWTKDQIVSWIQSDGKVEPEILIKQLSDRHQQEMAELKAERERERTELEGTRRQREFERVGAELSDYVKTTVSSDAEFADLRRLVEKNPQRFAPYIDGQVKAIIERVWKAKQVAVDPREALQYLQQELTELQLGPGQALAVKSANPAAVEPPSPITNHATSQRVVRPATYDESDPEARRARAAAILNGEIDE